MFNASDTEYDNNSLNISLHSSGGSLSPYLNIDPSYLNQDGGAEFVFATDSQKKRGWGERMFSSIGTSYMTGLTFGGSWGLYEGLRNPDGKTMKLRLNSVLNGMTRRGPFMANSLGVVALMYCSLNTGIEKVRGTEDMYNSVAAAVTTGALFKSTGGIRAIGFASAIGGSIAALYIVGDKLWNSRGQTWSSSTPNWA
eukprot:Seg795.6 transcript_id=Seg795.6/GoldUCD/mRNA.D3Y31 product="Mitochondrial import inner membrane translocase subunit Tim23" protein_id=Seg795.6/GoldUCD/D3Y31